MNSLRAMTAMAAMVISLYCVAQKKPEDIQAMKADAQKEMARADAAEGKDCTKVCLEAARKFTELSNEYFILGNVKDAHTAMDSAGRLAVKAGQAAIETKKRRKDTEIGLRKLQKRIHDIEETLNFEDRASVREIVNNIAKTRSEILMSMFGMPKKELGPPPKESEDP